MNEYIKIAIIPDNNPIGGKNRDGKIDFIFEAMKKDENPIFNVQTLNNEDDIIDINKTLSNFSDNKKFKDYQIYHFNYFRNYIKNSYPYLYTALKLDNDTFDKVKDSYIDFLLKLFSKLTEIGFISILNSEYVTIIYTPKHISSLQKNSLKKVRSIIDEDKTVSLIACSYNNQEKYEGYVDVIDEYLNSLNYGKKIN